MWSSTEPEAKDHRRFARSDVHCVESSRLLRSISFFELCSEQETAEDGVLPTRSDAQLIDCHRCSLEERLIKNPG